MQGQSEAMRAATPVWLSNFDAMPLDAAFTQVVIECCLSTFSLLIEVGAQMNHLPHKAQNVGVGLTKAPVEPTGFVILTICIVVPELGLAHFISHEQHRRPNGEQSEREKFGYRTRALHPTVHSAFSPRWDSLVRVDLQSV